MLSKKQAKLWLLLQQLDQACYLYGCEKEKTKMLEHITKHHTTIKPFVEYEGKINAIKTEIQRLIL